jgi:hypothetical protein
MIMIIMAVAVVAYHVEEFFVGQMTPRHRQGRPHHVAYLTVEKPVPVDGESDAVAHFQRGEGRDMASVHGAYGVAWGIAVLGGERREVVGSFEARPRSP